MKFTQNYSIKNLLAKVNYYGDFNGKGDSIVTGFCDDFFAKNEGARFFYLSSKAPKSYTDVEYQDGDFLLFGKETKGLPEQLLIDHPERCVRIPMISDARCINLSNAVAVVTYEALRQGDFKSLTKESDYLYGIID